MDRVTFPIPRSGQVKLSPVRDEVFEVQCLGVDFKDAQSLLEFFLIMAGRFGEFRFEHGGVLQEKCRFESDTGPTFATAERQDITFPIHILH